MIENLENNSFSYRSNSHSDCKMDCFWDVTGLQTLVNAKRFESVGLPKLSLTVSSKNVRRKKKTPSSTKQMVHRHEDRKVNLKTRLNSLPKNELKLRSVRASYRKRIIKLPKTGTHIRESDI